MSKQQFKVGDRVRVVKSKPSTINGKVGTLTAVKPLWQKWNYRVELDEKIPGIVKNVGVYEVEHIREKHPVIVITTDGKTTTATEREGKKVIKTATAKCSDKDTFDFAEGARVAFERLQGRDPFPKKEEKPERPEKLVCVKGGCGGYFKAGKVYGVKWRTGRDVFDFGGGPFGYAGYYQDGRYISPSSFGNAEFIPLVEG